MALTFLSPLHKAQRQISVHLAERMEALGTAGGECHLLAYLQSYGPCRIAELLRVFGHKPSTMTGMLDRLVERELVDRTVDLKDRRSFRVETTEAGADVAGRANRVVGEFEDAVRARITDEDLAGFQAVMQAIGEVTHVVLRPEKPE